MQKTEHDIPAREYRATLKFRTSGSNSPSESRIENDASIKRMDVYIFDEDGNQVNHCVMSDTEIAEGAFLQEEESGTRRYYLFLANLGNNTADYYSGLHAEQFRNGDGDISLEENYSKNRLMMGGSAKCFFEGDEDIAVDMFRYQYKIELGTITAGFEDPSFFDKDIFVKRIVMTNNFNICTLTKGSIIEDNGMPELLFGKRYTFGFELLGGVHNGYKAGYDPHFYDSISLQSPREERYNIVYPILINRNLVSQKRVMNVTATGELADATVHEFNNTGGQICSSSDKDMPHVLDVNKTFYGMVGCPDGTLDKLYDEAAPKLVIEVTIDGEVYYYPIQLNHPQPNTDYRISNITLGSTGSEYSNLYPIWGTNNKTKSTYIDWHECKEDRVIDNITVGVTY